MHTIERNSTGLAGTDFAVAERLRPLNGLVPPLLASLTQTSSRKKCGTQRAGALAILQSLIAAIADALTESDVAVACIAPRRIADLFVRITIHHSKAGSSDFHPL